MEGMVGRWRRSSRPGYRAQRSRTVLGVRFTQLSIAGGHWRTEDGYEAEVYEGDYGGWTLYTPGQQTYCAGSLKYAARIILRRRAWMDAFASQVFPC